MLHASTLIHSSELAIIIISFSIKAYLLGLLIPLGFQHLTAKRPWVFLLGTLIGSLAGDFAWILKLIRELGYIDLSYPSLVMVLRISWAFLVVQYQALSLFLESLIVKRFTFSLRHIGCCAVSFCFFSYFIILACTHGGFVDPIERNIAFSRLAWSMESPAELKAMCLVIYYTLFFLMLTGICLTVSRSRRYELPIIVRQQLSVLLTYIISSYLFVEILQLFSFASSITSAYLYPTVTVSTLLLSYAIYYGVKRVLGLRFLNMHSHVQSKRNGKIMHTFKHIVEQLSHVTLLPEVNHITQTFFKNGFDIPLHNSYLFIRGQQVPTGAAFEHTKNTQALVEEFLTSQKKSVKEYISSSKIIIYDELEFSNFYHETAERKAVLVFMQQLNADIFLPIFKKKEIIAYIIVDKHPRKKELYGDLERDEMIILANYLCNIIYLLKHRNLQSLIFQEKKLKDIVHALEEEAKHFKESIRSLTSRQQHQIGVILYKNRRFFYINRAAKELLSINLNIQTGHRLTKICRQITLQAQNYKHTQTVFSLNERGEHIILSAEPHIEQNTVVLLVRYPEIHDIINKELYLLQDPTKWDFLLYLQTTKTGNLISQLVPGTGEKLLAFKLNLMQAAFSKKTVLMQLPEDDLIPTAELLHHMGQGESLHVMALEKPSTDQQYAIELFGAHHLPDGSETVAFLKKLGDRGTLFIKNIHFLDLETQERLAEYIKYGHYRPIFSQHNMKSETRLLCSTQENLLTLVRSGAFSPVLYELLNSMVLTMTPPEELPQKELDSLADGLTEQAVKTADFKNMLELNEKDKMKLAYNRPHSLQHMRVQIESLLVHKSKKNHIFREAQFDPAYHITDPELTEAARLGKHALRHQRIMTLLWDKFHSQNKIAAFLGVNRSSVNRRCKQFKLE